MKVPVKIQDDRERVVGTYDRETNTFEKNVTDEHRMRMYGGSWGIDVEVLDKLAKHNSDIVLWHPDWVLMTTAKKWKELGIEANHGHRKQSFLQESKFDRKK